MFKDIAELKVALENSGGALTVYMGELRDALGYDRLGVHVKKQIGDELAKNGMGCHPELGDRSNLETRVFQLGTPTADLIAAVLNPSKASDALIVKAAGGKDAEVLARIKALVCE